MSENGEVDSIASDKQTVSKQVLELAKQVLEIIEDTKAGIDEQGKMAKKMGLKLFKKNARMPIEEWIQYAKDLQPEFEKLAKSIERDDVPKMDLLSEAKLKFVDLKQNYINMAKMVSRVQKGEELKNSLEGLSSSEKTIGLLIEAIEFLEKN